MPTEPAKPIVPPASPPAKTVPDTTVAGAINNPGKQTLQPKPPTSPKPSSPESLLPAPNIVVEHDPDATTKTIKSNAPLASGKDWDKATEHLGLVRQGALKKAGVTGCNPYMWLATHVEPLEKELRAKRYTDGLYNEIMALSKEPDVKLPQ